MNGMTRRNWLYEGEAARLSKTAMNASVALQEAFDRSDCLWNEETLPSDPMAVVDLADATRDLAAKSLIVLGVQEGLGERGDVVRFGERHQDAALEAIKHNRPLAPAIVSEVFQEWDAYKRRRHEHLMELLERRASEEEEARFAP